MTNIIGALDQSMDLYTDATTIMNANFGMTYKRSQMKLTFHVSIVSGETGYEHLASFKGQNKGVSFLC